MLMLKFVGLTKEEAEKRGEILHRSLVGMRAYIEDEITLQVREKPMPDGTHQIWMWIGGDEKNRTTVIKIEKDNYFKCLENSETGD